MRRSPMPRAQAIKRATVIRARKTPGLRASERELAKSREIVRGRADGRCESCGRSSSEFQFHHRQPRQMGGSPNTPGINAPSNLLALCESCHGLIEIYRQRAYREGFLVQRWAVPAATPVWYRGKRWVLLISDGSLAPVDDPFILPC